MIRKYMFLGLTLALVVALLFLVIRGRRMEKKQEGPKMEVVQEAPPSPTRVLAPMDLKIVRSKVAFTRQAGGAGATQSAVHDIEINSIGKTTYGRIQLLFEYINLKGKPAAEKSYSVEKILPPGGTINLANIKIESLPASISDFRVSIAWADLHEVP